MASSKGAVIGYIILTGLVVLSQGASGVADLAGVDAIKEGLTALGYPAYLMTILGVAKIAGVIVLAVPGVTRLKEWAYAGFAIDFLGATASHLLAGQAVGEAAPAFVFFLILMGSYFLRPPSRILAPPLSL
ncbi:MAG: DoxX family protein [Myxococcota bacterium]